MERAEEKYQAKCFFKAKLSPSNALSATDMTPGASSGIDALC